MSDASAKYWSFKRITFSVRSSEDQNDLTIDRPYAILGSGTDCDVVLNSKKVPRLAMLFVATSRGLRVLMLSAHSKRSGQCLRVEPDQPIRLGEYEITVQIDSTDTDSTPPELSEGPDILLATWRSGEHRRFFKLPNETPISIGRKAPAHVQIKDDRMSGQHCSLFRVGDTLWAIDLHSANGTSARSKAIQCAPLTIGQSLVAGTHRIHFTRLHANETFETLNSKLRADAERHESELRSLTARESEAVESLAQALAAERSATSRLEQSQVVTQKLEAKSQDIQSEVADLRVKFANSMTERDETSNQLEASNQEADSLRSELEELKARAATLERDLSETRELLNDKESLRQRELQLDTLQRELALERQILHELQLGVSPNMDSTESKEPDDESVISTFDFQDVLEEAMEGLPSIEED